jgi:hypothetical protein
MTQDQLFAPDALTYVKPAMPPIPAHLASRPITELLLMDNVSAHQDSIKLLIKMEALLVENAIQPALNVHSFQLSALTVIPIPTEFLDLMLLEIKFATVFLDSPKMPMEIVSNQTAMLIHTAQLVISS